MKRAKRRQHPKERAWVYRQVDFAPAWAMDADIYNGTPSPLVDTSRRVTVSVPYSEARYEAVRDMILAPARKVAESLDREVRKAQVRAVCKAYGNVMTADCEAELYEQIVGRRSSVITKEPKS